MMIISVVVLIVSITLTPFRTAVYPLQYYTIVPLPFQRIGTSQSLHAPSLTLPTLAFIIFVSV